MITGINITDVYDPKLEEKLKKLSGPRRTARVVIDTKETIVDAIPVVAMIGNYCDVMIQIQDSYGEAQLSDQELFEKAGAMFSAFEKDCSLWEIGNEVNGDWCSINIAQRVKKIWGMMPTGDKAALTLFWEPGMFEWYQRNPIQVDYVFISYYPKTKSDILSSGFSFYTEKITALNKNCKVGIGEFGFEEWSGPISWRTKISVRKQIEHFIVPNTGWVGGGFYWDGQTEGF